ncbi:MAG: 5-methylcytosine-specific restriction endonuclease system specificity protein McrC [Clostridiales bacterium]|nr:5-methylcytosine-specific restriction endonuclease system specificity protein McrC [Clostridiales bacterium]
MSKQISSIFIKNIYYMLSYAFRELDQGVYENIKKEEFENIHNLFAAILVKGIGKQLKQGLYREYISFNEDLVSLRGKINMPETVRNCVGQKKKLSCDYDELSVNNVHNQILKSTAYLLIKNENVDAEYKNELKKEILFFSEVDLINLTSVNWSGIRFHRNNNSYRMLVSVCQLIAEGMLLTTSEGEYRLASFVDDQRMCTLYEKFILEYYAKEWRILNTSAPKIKWALDDGFGTMLPTMQSDIVLQHRDKALIIDAKYYGTIMQTQFGVDSVRSNNLYQIFTYVKNLACEKGDGIEVAGMLLYAQTDSGFKHFVYQMSGNQISVKTLDLNKDFTEISNQLDSIVEVFFGLVREKKSL